jgi:hypothetical protein
VTSWTGDPVPEWMTAAPARERVNVWIAVGMLMFELNASSPDGLALLRGYAFSHDTVVDDVAAALITGQLGVVDVAA